MLVVPSASSSAHSVYITNPPSSLFHPNLSRNPPSISPPYSTRTVAHPFTISPNVYGTMLHIAWPITIAIIYAAAVYNVNRINKERNYKPWAFSKTMAFYVLVLTHNTLLAMYSGWTFFGMLGAIRRSWPGWNGEYGLAGAADALCKINGPRGPGSAATYSMESGSWTISDITMRLSGGSPDSTDVGRIWNEGLAFYGWIFYLSKFYELLDTAIILTKGKKSSFLQTYHHTGAMFAMWAGIRYMSPPIWMFTFINSGLHTLMYTYYTASALMIQVHPLLKRTLTFLQIVQILFGSAYAFAHLFVAYDIPYYAAYRVVKNLSTALPSAASTASSALASATASVNIGSWLKKAALRAAGEEGLAENVRNYNGETFGIDAIHAAKVEKGLEEITYKLSTTRTHCLDTSGQVFAILLNLIYLAPLAFLFISFFARYFAEGAKGDPPKRKALENTKVSADQAVKDVEQKLKEAMDDQQGGTTEPPPELKAELEEAKDKAKKATKDLNDSAQQKSKDVSDKVQNDLHDLRTRARQGATDAKDKIKDKAPELSAKAQERAAELGAKAKDVAQNVSHAAKDKTQAAKDAVSQNSTKAKDQASKTADTAGKKSPDDAQRNADNKGDNKKDKKEEKQKKDEKKDDKKKGDEIADQKPDGADKEKEEDSADPSAYEANPDLPKTEDEEKAEAKMQPNGK